MIKLQLSPRDKKILVIFLPLLLGGLIFWFIVFPQIKAYNLARSELAEAQQKIGRLKEKNQQLERETQSLNQAKEQFRDVHNKFAANMQDGLFIVNLDRKVRQEKVVVDTFNPLIIQKHPDYWVLPVELIMAGEYNRIIAVMDFLENQANLTELRDIFIISTWDNAEEDSENSEGPKASFSIDNILDLIEAHEGYVGVRVILMLYSEPSAKGRLYLEDIQQWRFGRDNPFKAILNPNASYLLYPLLIPYNEGEPMPSSEGIPVSPEPVWFQGDTGHG